MNLAPRIQVLKKYENAGMTLLETLLAISMLTVFTGVVAMVMQFTLKFWEEAESGQPSTSSGVSNGVLIDHQQLHIAMDALVEVLVQPGVDLAGSSHPQSEMPGLACTDNPVKDWGLTDFMDENKVKLLLPYGYRLCLWRTAKLENNSNPGIYLLQALPMQLSSSSLPVRRFFCRPRPYC